jgi:ribonuclease D
MEEEYKKIISKEEILELEQLQFEGQIFCINTDKELKHYLPQIKKCKILGFDTETKPNFVKGESNQNKVSLLQLSSLNKAYLIRLNNLKSKKSLFNVLAKKKTIKIGLAVRDDIKGLQKLQSFTPNNFIDLQKFTDKFGIEANGLRNITAIVLNKRLSKAQRLSNWENDTLQESQKIYAATDAWICLKIYEKLNK